MRYDLDPETGCHLWRGYIESGRYPKVTVNGQLIKVVRVLWLCLRGAVPAGQQLLHMCDRPSCINLDHIYLGSQQQNMTDMSARGRSATGSRNARAARTEADVALILVDLETMTGVEVAEKWAMAPSTVSKIKNGRLWRRALDMVTNCVSDADPQQVIRGNGPHMGEQITKTGIVGPNNQKGTVNVLDHGGTPLQIGDNVAWKPGPRAARESHGPITKYEHPYLTVNCADGKMRKVRPGAVKKR